MTTIVGRIEFGGRKLAVVSGVQGGYGDAAFDGFQVQDITHGEGRAMGNPYPSAEAAMRNAHEILFGVVVSLHQPRAAKPEETGYSYHEGNERSVGAGPETGRGSR